VVAEVLDISSLRASSAIQGFLLCLVLIDEADTVTWGL